MSDVKHNEFQTGQKVTPGSTKQNDFGRHHQDIDEDLEALKSVMGIPAFSSGLKQLKNSLSSLKSLFIN